MMILTASIDLLVIGLNLLVIFSAVLTTFYVSVIRNRFMGGVFEKPLVILRSVPLIGALAWSFHILYLFFDFGWIIYLHFITGAIFYLALLYGFLVLYHSLDELRRREYRTLSS